MKVYIAGPMAGYMKKQNYRKRIKKILNDLGIEYICPLEMDHGALGVEETNRLAEIGGAVKFTFEDRDLIRKRIVDRDLNAIDECDVMVAYVPFASHGTDMEIFYHSHIRNKPVIILDKNPKSWIIAMGDEFVGTYKELEGVLKRYRDIDNGDAV